MRRHGEERVLGATPFGEEGLQNGEKIERGRFIFYLISGIRASHLQGGGVGTTSSTISLTTFSELRIA